MGKEKTEKKISKRHIGLAIASVLFVGSILLFTFPPSSNIPGWKDIFRAFGVAEAADQAADYDMSVHFIDVGKADSIFITCKGKNILIDAGDVELSAVSADYLFRRGVQKLDLVVATHPDNDHIGGMANVLLEFPVQQFLMPNLSQETELSSTSYEMMRYALEEQKIPVTLAQPGQVMEVGEMQVEILAPQKEYEESNNNSVILRITYGKNSFLFMGDAEEKSEKDLLSAGYDLRSDVLKVGHHGSKTSTTEELLRQAAPQYAVISVGEDSNALPTAQTIKRLQEAGILVYRTDLNGTVVAATNGKEIKWFTERKS